MKPFGYNGKIIEIDLSWKIFNVMEFDENFYRIYAGGGLLGTYFLLKDTKAELNALNEENRLIFTSSVIACVDDPGLARFSVIIKSPLSGGIAETRCEGKFGQYLKGLGYDAIIIKGKSDNPVYLLIESGEISFYDASEIWDKNTYESTHKLEKRFGLDSSYAVIVHDGVKNIKNVQKRISLIQLN